MRYFLLLIFLTGFVCTGLTQENDTTVYQSSQVQNVAEFPGGDNAMLTHLRKVKYPENFNHTGRIYLKYIIEKDGSPSNIHLLRVDNPTLQEEFKKVMAEMPRWKPATIDNKPVRMQYTLPIIIHLK